MGFRFTLLALSIVVGVSSTASAAPIILTNGTPTQTNGTLITNSGTVATFGGANAMAAYGTFLGSGTATPVWINFAIG